MKTIWVLILITLFTSCFSKRHVKQSFADNKVEIHTEFDCAVKNADKALMIIVFSDNDSVKYNLPITKLLKIDSTKKDVSVYNSLARDFSVVKLYRKEFDIILLNKAYCDTTFTRAFSEYEYDPIKGFLFISGAPNIKEPRYLYFYFARPLDSPKEVIHDIICVKFGP